MSIFQNALLAGAAANVQTGADGLALYSWGQAGAYLQGNTTNICVPTQVGDLTDWPKGLQIQDRKVTGGSYYIFTKEDGTNWTSGNQSYGGMGTGEASTDYSSPVQIGSLTDWNRVRAIRTTLCIKTDGTLWGYGYGGAGQIGVGDTTTYSSPVQIGSDTDWTDAVVGNNSAAGIRGGKLFTWGHWESSGQNKTSYSSPVQIGSATNWTAVGCAPDNMYAIAGGAMYATGAGYGGANGQGNTTAYYTWVQVGALTNWSKITSSGNNAGCIVLKTDGTLWGWGNNAGGTLMASSSGAGDTRTSPIQLGDDDDWIDVDYGTGPIAAGIRDGGDGEQGTLWVWGLNYYGVGGNNNTTSSSSPVQVGSDTDWKACAVGDGSMVGLK